MTIPAWQPGTTYVPGALVVPRTTAAVPVSALDNPSFDLGNTGWTLDAALTIQNGGGYDGPWCLTFVADAPNGANATNNAVFATSPGQSFTVACMGRHDTGDDHSSDVGIAVDWYDKNNALITSTGGGGLPRLSQSGYQQVSLPVVAPAGAATFKVRLAPYRKSADNVQVDHVQLIGYTPPVSPRAVMYEATQPTPGKSGSAEPIWPPLGSSVTDNQVVWNGVNIDRIVWQASPLLESGATEPNWPTDPGGVVHDGTVDWVAYAPNITDANCPNTAVVAIMASKVFAVDKDIVRFCATANALDWTSPQDAGYLPTGLQQSNSNDMAVLAPYRGNLCAFNASCFQNWQVDPDPAAMALLDQMEGIGSVWPLAAHPVGNELYYLAALGVRSVSIAAGSDNLQAGDIGTPIDALVQAALAALPAGSVPRSMYYPGAGQYWLAFPGTNATVYVYTRNGNKGKWSRYVFPFPVDAFAQLGNDCYIRHGDIVSKLDETAVADEVNGAAVNFEGIVQWGWLDCGPPGATKMLESFDIVASGNPSVSIGYDQTDSTRFTTPYAVGPDTVPGTPIPLPMAAPSFSPKVTFPGGQQWTLQSMTLYLTDTLGQP